MARKGCNTAATLAAVTIVTSRKRAVEIIVSSVKELFKEGNSVSLRDGSIRERRPARGAKSIEGPP
jgi:hypothetical protein